MTDVKRVIIDAGHGGEEPGAMYDGRREKDDTLRLALAIGRILENNGVDVVYTRTTDVYDTPLEKARIANQSGADYFVSIHRNAFPVPGTASGAMTLVYEDAGVPAMLADNIQRNLVETGFRDLGVQERPGLIVLRKTQMPAVLVEAGFIDNPDDNRFFDENFDAIAQAIADGVLETIRQQEAQRPEYYQVQVGAFRTRMPAEDGSGAARAMENAIKDAGMAAEDIDYVNAHGTSTHHNDLFETKAIRLALGDHAEKVKINSTKSMIGHLLGAAGGVEFITCVKSIQDGFVHATAGLEKPGEGCDLDYTMGDGVSMNVDVAISNSLGFGGHNASLIVKKFSE